VLVEDRYQRGSYGMLFETNPVDLKELIARAKSGLIQLPDFQRGWVWDDERIAALLVTVARGYPLGVMMTMETGNPELEFRSKPLVGTSPPDVARPEQLLMDGQQRLTSLSQALASAHAVETMDSRRKRLLRYYYIDIWAAAHNPEQMENAVFSVPDNKKLPRTDEHGKRIAVDLTTQDNEIAAGMFPLRLVYAPGRSHWRRAYEKVDPETWDLFHDRVLSQIDGYKVPVIRLTKGATKEAICAVFEDVNTRGVSLTVFELLTASYAVSDFHLPTDWAEVREQLAKTSVLTDFKDTDFLRAISLVSTYFARRGRIGTDPYTAPAASCKRSDILGLKLSEYQKWSPQIVEALEWSVRFLARQGIYGKQEMPYISQLSSLAAIRTVLGGEADDRAVEDKIVRWFWCGVLGEQYSGALDSRLPRDLEQVYAWVKGGREPTSVSEASFSAARLNTMTTRNSAAYKGVCGLLLKQGCIDWTHSREPIDATIYRDLQVNIALVFPKGWFGKDKGKGARLDSIVNKTLVTSRTNRIMGSLRPSDYVAKLEDETGLPPNWFDDVIATHLIDPKSLRADDFEAFYAARSAALLRLIQDAMGRLPVDEPETLADYEPEPEPVA
jgi:hypothetical protein